ncbi:hypothetical protein MSG28_014107 [Choristoneura fumiferana]|uniref:Uncharacterized protein n=1 Tax=Choristoneura fumiferana TaxID=7141 RepID=A0ACC0JFZ6_CHOFU|nr:hypothetical protein MSG28_014107 [Choristoneura fumiferana]
MYYSGGLAVSGHTAVTVRYNDKSVMLVFFGHSPHYGYLHLVQGNDGRMTWLKPRAVNRSNWRSMEEVYVQQWTSYG